MRAKLAAAEAAGPEYARNAEALRAVQPEDVLPGDIDANLGAPWIPESDIQAFAADLFGVEPDAIQVAHLKKDAVWSVEAGYSAEQSVAATVGLRHAAGQRHLAARAGAEHEDAGDLRPRSRPTPTSGWSTRRRRSPPRRSRRPIKEKFQQWVFTDPDRTERLVRLYNDNFNNLRPRLFDGSHLDFPGHEPGDHAAAAPEGRRVADHERRQHAAGARASGPARRTSWPPPAMKMKQAGLVKKPHDRRAQPHAGAVRPRVPAALPERQAAGRRPRRTSPRSAASS